MRQKSPSDSRIAGRNHSCRGAGNAALRGTTMIAASAAAAKAPRHAEGVTYTVTPDMAGAELFRCETFRATLSVASCGKRWRQTRDMSLEDRTACYGCIVGAAHSGEEPDRRSRLYGLPICPRCRRRTMRRMIGNRRCINCYNREMELVRGKNSKGRPPRKLRLGPARLGLVIDPGGAGERYVELAEPAVRDNIELLVAAMRVVDGAVAITRPRGGVPSVSIAELAGMFAAKPMRLSSADLRAADIVRRHRRSRKRDAVTPPAAGAA
jgi:hypothetical protein